MAVTIYRPKTRQRIAADHKAADKPGKPDRKAEESFAPPSDDGARLHVLAALIYSGLGGIPSVNEVSPNSLEIVYDGGRSWTVDVDDTRILLSGFPNSPGVKDMVGAVEPDNLSSLVVTAQNIQQLVQESSEERPELPAVSFNGSEGQQAAPPAAESTLMSPPAPPEMPGDPFAAMPADAGAPPPPEVQPLPPSAGPPGVPPPSAPAGGPVFPTASSRLRRVSTAWLERGGDPRVAVRLVRVARRLEGSRQASLRATCEQLLEAMGRLIHRAAQAGAMTAERAQQMSAEVAKASANLALGDPGSEDPINGAAMVVSGLAASLLNPAAYLAAGAGGFSLSMGVVKHLLGALEAVTDDVGGKAVTAAISLTKLTKVEWSVLKKAEFTTLGCVKEEAWSRQAIKSLIRKGLFRKGNDDSAGCLAYITPAGRNALIRRTNSRYAAAPTGEQVTEYCGHLAEALGRLVRRMSQLGLLEERDLQKYLKKIKMSGTDNNGQPWELLRLSRELLDLCGSGGRVPGLDVDLVVGWVRHLKKLLLLQERGRLVKTASGRVEFVRVREAAHKPGEALWGADDEYDDDPETYAGDDPDEPSPPDECARCGAKMESDGIVNGRQFWICPKCHGKQSNLVRVDDPTASRRAGPIRTTADHIDIVEGGRQPSLRTRQQQMQPRYDLP